MIKDKNLKFALITIFGLFGTAVSLTAVFSFYHNINLQKQARLEKQNQIEKENLRRFQQEFKEKELKEKERSDKKIFWNKSSYALESIKDIFVNDDGYEILAIDEKDNQNLIQLDKNGIKISSQQIPKNLPISDYVDLSKDKNSQIQKDFLAKAYLQEGYYFDGAIYDKGKFFVLAHRYIVPNEYFAYLMIYDENFNFISKKFLDSFIPKQTKLGQIARFKIAKFRSGFLFVGFLERFDDETEGQFDLREFDLNGNLIDKVKVSAYPPYTKINCIKSIYSGVLIGGETFYDDISQKVFNHEITNIAFSKREAILIKIDSNASLSEQKIKPFGGKFERKAWGD